MNGIRTVFLAVAAIGFAGCVASPQLQPETVGFRNLSPSGELPVKTPPYKSAAHAPSPPTSSKQKIMPSKAEIVGGVSNRMSHAEVQKRFGAGDDIEIVITDTEPNYDRIHYRCVDGTVVIEIKKGLVTAISEQDQK